MIGFLLRARQGFTCWTGLILATIWICSAVLPCWAGGIEGRVTKPDGSPFGSASVCARRHAPPYSGFGAIPAYPFHFTLTDSSGLFHFSGLDAANYEVGVGAESYNYLSSHTNVEVTFEGIVSNVDFQMRIGGVIAGNVTDTNLLAIANVQISAYGSNGAFAASATSDSNGAFQIKGLASGAYRIRTGVNNQQNYLDEWFDDIPAGQDHPLAGAVAVVEGFTSSVHFALSPGGEISGTVRNLSGAGLSNILVQVTSSNGTQLASVESDADGAYRLVGLVSGSYWLQARVEDSRNYLDQWYAGILRTVFEPPSNATPVQVTAGSAIAGLDFDLVAGGIIRGTVRSREGAVLAGASIAAEEFQDRFEQSAVSDSQGGYEINKLPGGFYTIAASHSAQNYLEQETALKIDDEELLENIDFALGQGCVIQGFVTNAAGSPITNALVRHYEQNPGCLVLSFPSVWFSSPNTDSNGFYRIPGISAGAYNVTVQSLDNRYQDQYKSVLLSYDTPTGIVDFCLATACVARIYGLVKDAEDQVLTNLQVVAVTSNGSWKAFAFTSEQGEFMLTLSEGEPVCIRTVAGEGAPWVDVWYGGAYVTNFYGPVSAVIDLAEGGVVSNLLIVLPTGCSLSGCVKDDDGTPLEGITMLALDDRTELTAVDACTDAQGKYELQGLYPANYVVNAGGGGYLQEWYDGVSSGGSPSRSNAVPVAVSLGNTPTNIDFSLSQGAALRVCVSNRYGALLAEARVHISQSTAGPFIYSLWGDTDANGRYEVRGLNAQAVHVVASSGGYESQSADASLTLGATALVHFALEEISPEAAAPDLRQENLTFAWTVPPQGLYRIESSTNLIDWFQVIDGAAVDQKSEQWGNPSLKIEYRKTAPSLHHQDFYRLRKLE